LSIWVIKEYIGDPWGRFEDYFDESKSISSKRITAGSVSFAATNSFFIVYSASAEER
jgi:hypothetical protein